MPRAIVWTKVRKRLPRATPLTLGALLGIGYLLAVGGMCQVRAWRNWLPGELAAACTTVLP